MSQASHDISAVVFDVNETLSDMSPLRARFEHVGVPGALMSTWFAGVLRDGFALTAAGGFVPFAELAADGLRGLLENRPGWAGDAEEAARYVMAGFAELDVHADVAVGMRRLREAGLRLATMTNGTAELTRGLLDRAGLLGQVELLLDVQGPRAWKPAPAAYHYATGRLGVAAADALLVAVHPWDIDGARRAGLRTAWLRRGTIAYPRVMAQPTLIADDLTTLATRLTRTRS